MKHLAFAAIVGMAIFLILNLIFGEAGTREESRLVGHRERLEENIVTLEALNTDLTARVDRLRSDPDLLRLEARALGYYEANDRVIRFEDYARKEQPTTPGKAIRSYKPVEEPDGATRAAATGAGLLTLILMLMWERFRENRAHTAARANAVADEAVDVTESAQ